MSERTNGALVEEERRLSEHLARAGELLRSDQLDEAAREIDGALGIRKDDLRARNLRGLLLFRAGRYDEALTVYLELSEAHADDAALRLNLGLVQLRMGRNALAAESLRRVAQAEPQNARAQGYLGLALMRAGELREAREAFVKAGQADLVRQIDERLQGPQGLSDPSTARAGLQRAANEGSRLLDSEQPFVPVELEPQIDDTDRVGAWQVRLAGERAPLPAPEGPPNGMVEALALSQAMPVGAFATARMLRPGGIGEPFAISPEGMLVVRVVGKLPLRTEGVVASSGQLRWGPLERRVRGTATQDPFGVGTDAMMVAIGEGVVVVAPRGARFTALQLNDDILYVREASLFAFEETLHWENGRVPGGDIELRVVQFRGSGQLVLRAHKPLYSFKLQSEASMCVDAAALAGWIGRVVPRSLKGESGLAMPYVECTGEGMLILEEPAASG